MSTSTTARPPRTLPSLGRATALAALGAAAVVAALHLLFDAAGAEFVVAPPGQEEAVVGFAQAAAVAGLVTALGGGVATLLARVSRRPSRLFLVAVGLVLAFMAVNPVLAADQALTVVALELEHLAAATVALVFLLPPLRARDAAQAAA